jgi:hypothetical protein
VKYEERIKDHAIWDRIFFLYERLDELERVRQQHWNKIMLQAMNCNSEKQTEARYKQWDGRRQLKLVSVR